jgi:peroxiredoxin
MPVCRRDFENEICEMYKELDGWRKEDNRQTHYPIIPSRKLVPIILQVILAFGIPSSQNVQPSCSIRLLSDREQIRLCCLYEITKHFEFSGGLIQSLVYRGHWCPFCQAYLKSHQSLLPAITAAGGKVIAITAEPEQHLESTRSLTGYSGEIIVDPENQIAAELKRRGKLDVAISSKAGYEHGMAQPAILVMQSDGTVLYDWAIVPSVMNLGGAKDRPDLKQVWENMEAKMDGKPEVHKKYDLQSFAKVIWGKVFG